MQSGGYAVETRKAALTPCAGYTNKLGSMEAFEPPSRRLREGSVLLRQRQIFTLLFL